MARVTDLNFPMEDKLKRKLDLMIARSTGKQNQDNVVLIDGDEGTGKTNIAAGICYYFAHETKRPLTMKNVFFNLDELIKFALENEEQIIWWDEGALGGLAADWWNANQKKFMKVLMVARKRKHFFVICIPKFFKLNEYFVVDRSIALIHTYARRNVKIGRFVYFSKSGKEALFNAWKRKRTRMYKRYYKFHGSFPEIIGKVDGYPISEKEYEKEKERAIMSIGSEKERKDERTLEKEKHIKILKNIRENKQKITQKEIAKMLGVSVKTIQRYEKELKEENDTDRETK
jgi:DNA-binding transcriptional regulator YiaG